MQNGNKRVNKEVTRKRIPHSERSLTSVRFLMRPNWLSTTPAQKKPRIYAPKNGEKEMQFWDQKEAIEEEREWGGGGAGERYFTGLALTTRKAGTTSTVTPRKVSVSNPRSLITSTALAMSIPAAARTRSALLPRRHHLLLPLPSADDAEAPPIIPTRSNADDDAPPHHRRTHTDTDTGAERLLPTTTWWWWCRGAAAAAAAAMEPEYASLLRTYVLV